MLSKINIIIKKSVLLICDIIIMVKINNIYRKMLTSFFLLKLISRSGQTFEHLKTRVSDILKRDQYNNFKYLRKV